MTGLKKPFKTSYITVLIKILFEFTRFLSFKTLKKPNSFRYKQEGGLYPSWGGGGVGNTGRIYCLTVDGPIAFMGVYN